YNAFVSLSSLHPGIQTAFNQDWFRLCCFTYLLFDRPVQTDEFRDEMDDFARRYIDPYVATFGSQSSPTFDLQALGNIHFYNSRDYDSPNGNKNYVTIFILLPFFILAIGCINYILLSLSQLVIKAKHVGFRNT